MKRQADRHRSQAPNYEIGDKVWLSTENLKLTRASKKLTKQWLGPYDITKRIGDNTIELRLPRSMKIHPVVNISRVKPYKECLKRPTYIQTRSCASHRRQRNRVRSRNHHRLSMERTPSRISSPLEGLYGRRSHLGTKG